METILSLLAGSVIKLYDDLTDTHKSYKHIELVKILVVFFLTMFLLLDPHLSLFFVTTMVPSTLLVGQLDHSFWQYLVCVPVLTTLFTFHKLEYLGLFDLIQRFILMVGSFLIILLEALLFPEESSTEKTIVRLAILPVLLALIWMTRSLSSGRFVMYMSLFTFGYFATNLIYQNWDTLTESKNGFNASSKEDTIREHSS
jgi:hypothetical protein